MREREQQYYWDKETKIFNTSSISRSTDRRLTDRLTDLDHTLTYCDTGRRNRI